MAEDTDLSLNNAHLRKNLTNSAKTLHCPKCNQEHRIYTMKGNYIKNHSRTYSTEHVLTIEYYTCGEEENILSIKDIDIHNDPLNWKTK